MKSYRIKTSEQIAWNSGIFNMLRSLSETVVLPIAAAILALVGRYMTVRILITD